MKIDRRPLFVGQALRSQLLAITQITRHRELAQIGLMKRRRLKQRKDGTTTTTALTEDERTLSVLEPTPREKLWVSKLLRVQLHLGVRRPSEPAAVIKKLKSEFRWHEELYEKTWRIEGSAPRL